MIGQAPRPGAGLEEDATMSDPKDIGRIKITKDGAYCVTGKVPLAQDRMIIGTDGEPEKWEKGCTYADRDTYALCRCGKSKDKPFCDGSHFEIAFDGTEMAGRDAYLEHVERTVGPGLDLTWSPEFCAVARFCHKREEAWGYVERSDDPEAREVAVEEACACPSGSLVAWDKETGAAIEPELEPSISLIENPQTGTSGPLCVKGGIRVESADGFEYEPRNRVTLCRCGESENKPFCDGSHVAIGFKSET
jgi:CDGSH-type Zn-finger protein